MLAQEDLRALRPVVEEELPEAAALDALEKLLRDVLPDAVEEGARIGQLYFDGAVRRRRRVDAAGFQSYAVGSVTRAAETPVPCFGFLFARVFAR